MIYSHEVEQMTCVAKGANQVVIESLGGAVFSVKNVRVSV